MKAWVEAARMAEMRYNYGIMSNKLDVEMVGWGQTRKEIAIRIRAINTASQRTEPPHTLFALPMTIVVIRNELIDNVRTVDIEKNNYET
jgi:hypothetical protein